MGAEINWLGRTLKHSYAADSSPFPALVTTVPCLITMFRIAKVLGSVQECETSMAGMMYCAALRSGVALAGRQAWPMAT